jgi:hypothetical protein
MNPPGGRVGVLVGVRDGVEPPGVRVTVGGAGVRDGVAVGTGTKYLLATQPAPNDVVTGTQVSPPAATDGPLTVTVAPLESTPRLGVLVLAPERRLTRVVVRRIVPVGKLPGPRVAVAVPVTVMVRVAVGVAEVVAVDVGVGEVVDVAVVVEVPVPVGLAVRVADDATVAVEEGVRDGVLVAVVVARACSTSANSPNEAMYAQCVPCSDSRVSST